MAKMNKVVGFVATTAIIASSVIYGPSLISNYQCNSNATQTEIVSNSSFKSQLDDIYNNYDVMFNNPDLYRVVSSEVNGNLTVDRLRNITSLTIDMSTLDNNDLSDLKYLINLEKLNLVNGVIDCSELSYNQNLTKLELTQCNLSNMSELPNSIYNLYLKNCNVTDQIVSIPYDTVNVSLLNSIFGKIVVKNPLNVQSFLFNGYGLLDLEDIKDCVNIKSLSLLQCPNVSHPEVIAKLSNVSDLKVDEFICVWGNEEIPGVDRDYYNIMKRLDQIAEEITEDDYTEEQKIEHISLFVLSKIEYDYASLNSDLLLTAYNTQPLSYALKEGRGVCVGYATLFTALANRLGLDNYQPDSVDHTWNMVKKASDNEYRAYDMTQLDNPYVVTGTFQESVIDRTFKTYQFINNGKAESLLFYDFNPDEAVEVSYSYDTLVNKSTIDNVDTSIGYINLEAPSREDDTNSLRLKIAGAELSILAILNAFSSLVKSKKEAKKLELKARRTNYR